MQKDLAVDYLPSQARFVAAGLDNMLVNAAGPFPLFEQCLKDLKGF